MTTEAVENDWQDIGYGVSIRVVVLDGEEYGIEYRHPVIDRDKPCRGWVSWQGPGDNWTVEQREPLTLSPSLLCRACGHHGFVRGGKWVPV